MNYPDWKNRTILIADDDPVSHILLQETLKHTSITILHAFDGTDAFKECIENQGIQLIIMDIRMPGMNGLEATRLIRKYRPEIPVIFYSALRVQENKHLIKKLNCDDYLLKPVAPTQIIQILSKYLDLQAMTDPAFNIFLS